MNLLVENSPNQSSVTFHSVIKVSQFCRMGSLLSIFESIVSVDVDKDKGSELRSPPLSARKTSEKAVRMLLLGTGMSGKSTFFLQYQVMKNSMGPNRTLYKNLVFRNVTQNILEVGEACNCDDSSSPFENEGTADMYKHLKDMLSEFNANGRDDFKLTDIKVMSGIFEDGKFLKKFLSHRGFRYFDNID